MLPECSVKTFNQAVPDRFAGLNTFPIHTNIFVSFGDLEGYQIRSIVRSNFIKLEMTFNQYYSNSGYLSGLETGIN